jgi:hypothetical protein
VIYVRGLVRPAADLAVPGVECRYVRGAVKEVNLGHSFAADKRSAGHRGRPPSDATLELLTRVEVTSAPASWNSDLVLETGAPAAIEVALLIDRHGLPLLWGASTVLGMLLSVFLPWVILPREKRRGTDWLWAAAVGAATGLSVWVATLVFLAWNALRFPERSSAQRAGGLGRVILILGASGAFLILVAGALLKAESAEAIVVFSGGLGLLLLALCFPAGLICLLARVGERARAVWFVLFMVTHGGLACLLFLVLRGWLSAYG